MSALVERILRVSQLSRDQAEHLRRLCSSWQVLADLSFSDLLLYVVTPARDTFEIVAQIRPFTAQTLYSQDMVGTRVTQPEQPIVERAFREGRVWAQDAPVLFNGIPIRMDAVPVRLGDDVLAVLTKEGSPGTSRRPGRLEQAYLEAADHVSRMICEGVFPWRDAPGAEWPRVGDGLFLLDEAGAVSWASPNAQSSLRRLGVRENVLGRRLDDLGAGRTPVADAMAHLRLLDGELARGETYVRLRVMPLVRQGDSLGALVLARDISEVRQKERVISVKDATIREIHHRVKNNLQTIASLLRLQSRRLRSEEAKAALEESVLRISSIALVHETLSEEPGDVAEFGEVARRVARMVAEGLMLPDRDVTIDVHGSAGPLGAELATPLAVVLTELLQNSLEHAFPDGRGGTVSMSLARRNGHVEVCVADDGVGLGDVAQPGARLGLQIVRSLIEELGGTFELTSAGGTMATVTLPAARRAP